MSSTETALSASLAIDRSRLFNQAITVLVAGFSAAQGMLRELRACAREDGEDIVFSRKDNVIAVHGVDADSAQLATWRVNLEISRASRGGQGVSLE